MQKKILTLSFVLVLALLCICIQGFASDDITLVINNEIVSCDVPPIISNDRTLVPVRVLFEHLDADVYWDPVLRQVVVASEGKIMIFNIDSKIMYLNDKSYTLDAAPIIKDDRTMVPIRFVSENLGFDVDWDGGSRTVYVSTPLAEEDKPHNETVNKNGPKLSSISVKESDTTYKIIIDIEQNIKPRVMTLSEPHRLIFDFYGVNQLCSDGNAKSYLSSIVETRWAYHEEFTRIVVESLAECDYITSYNNGVYTIDITKPVLSDDEPTEPPEELIVPAGTPLVVLDAGHGGYDPGAVGRDSGGNIILYEKEVCLKIAQMVKQKLEYRGIAVLMTRTGDVALGSDEMTDLLERAKIANDAEADLFVSIHNNAFTTSEASGTCVLYSGLTPSKDYGVSGKDVAQNIQELVVKATGLRDRGVVARPNIVVLRETKMPAVLIECAFITCPADQQILSNDVKLTAIAEAICNGIVKSLGS